MPIEGFDYKAFAADLTKQAMQFLSEGTNAAPSSLTPADKKNIIETVNRFCIMAGEALYKDPNGKLNAQQACLVTQFIGEWTFHKSIDLVSGKIPQEYRGPILQAIAANIFNTAQLAIIKKIPDDALISLVEDKVKQVYNDEIQKLVKKGVLSNEQADSAVKASNINDYVQKTEDEAELSKIPQKVSENDKKVLKLAALAIVLKRLPEDKANPILNSLAEKDIQHVINYMKMSNLEDKVDHSLIINELKEIKKIIPPSESVNIAKLLKKHRRLITVTKPQKLSRIAMNERETVKNFILDAEYPAEEIFSPQVIKALVNTIEDKINDNKKEIHKH